MSVSVATKDKDRLNLESVMEFRDKMFTERTGNNHVGFLIMQTVDELNASIGLDESFNSFNHPSKFGDCLLIIAISLADNTVEPNQKNAS